MYGSLGSFNLECRRYEASITEHKHSYHQIVLPNSGKMEIEIAGCSGIVDQTQGAFIASSARHKFRCLDDGAFLVLDIFDIKLIGPFYDSGTFEYLNSHKFFCTDDKIRHLLKYASSKNMKAYQPFIHRAWATLIMTELFEAANYQLSPKIEPIHKAMEYIRSNLSKKITLLSVAKEAGVSERSLHSIFVDNLGTTPYSYIVARRIEHAMFLLQTTQKSVSEIASLSGYIDHSALSRSMQKRHGITPAQFRQSTQRKG